MKRPLLALLLLAVLSTAWFFAGYASGRVVGRGWRGALVDAGCHVICPMQLARR